MANIVRARSEAIVPAAPEALAREPSEFAEAFRWACEAWRLRPGGPGVVVPADALAAMLRAIGALATCTAQHDFPIERGPAGGQCRRCGLSPMAVDALDERPCSHVLIERRALLELLRHR